MYEHVIEICVRPVDRENIKLSVYCFEYHRPCPFKSVRVDTKFSVVFVIL